MGKVAISVQRLPSIEHSDKSMFNQRCFSPPDKISVLPMHGSLTNEEQLRVFQRALNGQRKVIVATNVAEASITIPGIVYGLLHS